MSDPTGQLSDAEKSVVVQNTLPKPTHFANPNDNIAISMGATTTTGPLAKIDTQNLSRSSKDQLQPTSSALHELDTVQPESTDGVPQEKEDSTVTASKALSGWRGTKTRFEKKDQIYMREFDDEVNALLVFAGLFSAILTAFIIEVYQTLKEDYTETSALILRRISLQLANATLDEVPLPPIHFRSSPIPRAVNVLWFSSLLLSVFAALFGIFVKQWLHTYGNWSLIGNPKDAVRVRHWYRRGMAKWRVEDIAASLPLLLQMALFCFVAGLVTYLWTLDYVVAGFATSFVVAGAGLAIVAIVLPYWNPDCPFKSPLGLAFIRTQRGNRHRQWQSHDLVTVKAEWDKLDACSPGHISKEMCVLLELVPETEESPHNPDLVKARVNELEVHQEPSSFETLCSLMTTHLLSTPGVFSHDAYYNIACVLSALTSGTKYPMPVDIIQRLALHAASTRLASNTTGEIKTYMKWLYMFAGCVSLQEESWKTPAIREAVATLSQCVQQWHLSARSMLTSMHRRRHTKYISNLDKSWPVLYNRLHNPVLSNISLHLPVLAAVSSPSGSRIITGHNDGSMTLLDGDTGKSILTFDRGHTAFIWCIAFSPSYTQVATGSSNNTVRVWDVTTGNCIKTLQGHTKAVTGVAFSPDSSYLVSVSYDSTIRWWNTETGELVTQIVEKGDVSLRRVVFSANGVFIALGLGSVIRIRYAQSAPQIRDFEGHADSVSSIAISSDCQRILSGSHDKTARIWDIGSGNYLHVLSGHTSVVTAVAFSEDCRFVVTGSDDQTVRTWDVYTGAVVRTFKGHSGGVRFTAFTSNSRRVISAAVDSTVCIWDAIPAVTSTSLALHTDHINNIRGVSWTLSPDGQYIASGLDNGLVRIWDAGTSKLRYERRLHAHSVTCVAYSQDGLRLLSVASNESSINIWDVESERDPQDFNAPEGTVNCAVFSFDGALIASGATDGIVRLWDLDRSECIHTLKGHENDVLAVVFAPDGSRVASGSEGRSVCLWDTETGECVHKLTGHSEWVQALTFSPDGLHVVSGLADGTVRLWSTEDGICQQTLTGNTSHVFHVAYSTDGRSIMARGEHGDWHTWHAPYDFPSPSMLSSKTSAPLITLENDGWIVGRKDSQAPKQRLYWLIPERRGVMYVQGHRVFVDATRGFVGSYNHSKNSGIVSILNFAGFI